jgi:hypothetical protein
LIAIPVSCEFTFHGNNNKIIMQSSFSNITSKSGNRSNSQALRLSALQQLNASDSSLHSTAALLASLSGPANEDYAGTGDILNEALQVSADLEQFMIDFYEEEAIEQQLLASQVRQ